MEMLYIGVSKKGRYSYDRMIEYAAKMAEQKKSILVTPQSITDEILTMVNRLSEVYLSSIMYPPDYFERKYLVQKKRLRKKWVWIQAAGSRYISSPTVK